MEETKGRTSDLSPIEPRRSSDRRNETESRSRAEKRDFDLSPSDSRRSSDRRNETESRSRAEKRVRFQDSDLSPSEPRRRSDRRHETESRSWEENRETKETSLRISETGPIRDHKGHLQEQRQSSRDVEIQRRRSYETESRSLEHKNRVDYPSAYSIRPSEEDCRDYRRRGLCSRGRSCRFNHPIHLRGACKYFLRGSCTNDSACRYYHSTDVAETVHQATSSDRRHGTGSSSRPEKRARDIPDSRERDRRGRFEDINRRRDGTVAEFKRARLEIPLQQQGDGNSESQGREGQDNVEEQRLMEIPLQQQGDGNSEPQRREGQENVEEQRLMEIEDQRARDQQIREEEQPRDIARERMEHRMKLDQVKQTVKFGESHRAEAELKELVFGRREGDGL